MQLGWIDFSKSERSKVLSVLELISERGTLDELGIAPIRDGFADLFFPGTSTIQTRAKYFFIVPYALKELEHSEEKNSNQILKQLDEIERFCGKTFYDSSSSDIGIIGQRALSHGTWVKRTPSDIYWAGLKKYGIFTGGNLSLSEYVRAMTKLKNSKSTLKKLGNKNDKAEEGEKDDDNTGSLQQVNFWKMPLYNSNWRDNLRITLSEEEAKFLKEQIVQTCPNSMVSFILKNNLRDVMECASFEEFESIVNKMPQQMQEDYTLARNFSDFNYILRVIYNVIVSDNQNEEAMSELSVLEPAMPYLANINIDAIFTRLHIPLNIQGKKLKGFLIDTQKSMLMKDVNGLKERVIRREIDLKGSARAKTKHPGEFGKDAWFCGRLLDYRFSNAKQIIFNDIFNYGGVNA